MDKNNTNNQLGKTTDPVISAEEMARNMARLDEKAKNDEYMSHEEFEALLHGKDWPEREPDHSLEK